MNRCSDVARVRHSPVICSFTGCSGHIGHFRASGAEHVRIAPAHSQPALAVYAHHRSRTQSARPIPKQCQFGIRVKLRSTDPFKNLVGAEWNKEHWFATREERDRALKEMSGRYVYFRPGDQPSLEFEKIDK